VALFSISCTESEVEPAVISTTSGTSDIRKQEKVIFHTVATRAEGSTYFGTVKVTGGIKARGTYIMPTEEHGTALHCILFLHLPKGTIKIRMNCNMVTMNGQWKVLEGTCAYKNLKGGGSLVMPDDVQEILTGEIFWK